MLEIVTGSNLLEAKQVAKDPKNKNGQVEEDKQHNISDCQCDVYFIHGL